MTNDAAQDDSQELQCLHAQIDQLADRLLQYRQDAARHRRAVDLLLAMPLALHDQIGSTLLQGLFEDEGDRTADQAAREFPDLLKKVKRHCAARRRLPASPRGRPSPHSKSPVPLHRRHAMRPILIVATLLMASSSSFADAQSAVELYVAPSGNDDIVAIRARVLGKLSFQSVAYFQMRVFYSRQNQSSKTYDKRVNVHLSSKGFDTATTLVDGSGLCTRLRSRGGNFPEHLRCPECRIIDAITGLRQGYRGDNLGNCLRRLISWIGVRPSRKEQRVKT